MKNDNIIQLIKKGVVNLETSIQILQEYKNTQQQYLNKANEELSKNLNLCLNIKDTLEEELKIFLSNLEKSKKTLCLFISVLFNKNYYNETYYIDALKDFLISKDETNFIENIFKNNNLDQLEKNKYILFVFVFELDKQINNIKNCFSKMEVFIKKVEEFKKESNEKSIVLDNNLKNLEKKILAFEKNKKSIETTLSLLQDKLQNEEYQDKLVTKLQEYYLKTQEMIEKEMIECKKLANLTDRIKEINSKEHLDELKKILDIDEDEQIKNELKKILYINTDKQNSEKHLYELKKILDDIDTNGKMKNELKKILDIDTDKPIKDEFKLALKYYKEIKNKLSLTQIKNELNLTLKNHFNELDKNIHPLAYREFIKKTNALIDQEYQALFHKLNTESINQLIDKNNSLCEFLANKIIKNTSTHKKEKHQDLMNILKQENDILPKIKEILCYVILKDFIDEIEKKATELSLTSKEITEVVSKILLEQVLEQDISSDLIPKIIDYTQKLITEFSLSDYSIFDNYPTLDLESGQPLDPKLDQSEDQTQKLIAQDNHHQG
ncbi:MAG: hypothetical protein U1E31_01150 [Rickettsiales bacterium]